jgi:hypothetical protein
MDQNHRLARPAAVVDVQAGVSEPPTMSFRGNHCQRSLL